MPSIIPEMPSRTAASLQVTVASEGFRLTARACFAGSDLVVTLTGGARPHVGCVVLARPHPGAGAPGRTSVTSSVLAIPPHREEALARPLAETLARELGVVVAVAAGVHDDGLDAHGIATYLRLGNEVAAVLLARLRQSPAGTPSA